MFYSNEKDICCIFGCDRHFSNYNIVVSIYYQYLVSTMIKIYSYLNAISSFKIIFNQKLEINMTNIFIPLV